MHTLDKRNNLKLIKYTLTSKNRKINPNKQIKEILRQEQSQWNKNRKTIEKINEIKIGSLERLIKLRKRLARLS